MIRPADASTVAREQLPGAQAIDPRWPAVDHFLIRGPLGADGMGEVYRAHDLQLQRDVALKVPRAILRDAQDQFLAEARALAKLNHPHVVAVHSWGRAGPHVYFTMDLVEGPNAATLITRLRDREVPGLAGPRLLHAMGLDLARVSSKLMRGACQPQAYYRLVALWLAEVAEGLHAAHQHRILHRDIKPSNLLLAPDGRMLLADFGLAQPLDSPGSEYEGVTGTYPYIAPERAAGDWARVDHRSDIWALGATLYEFLTYERAYPRRGKEVLQDIVTTDPCPPRKTIAAVPIELERICLKALRRAPDERYQSAHRMAEDLRAWAERRRSATVWVTGTVALGAALVLALLGLTDWPAHGYRGSPTESRSSARPVPAIAHPDGGPVVQGGPAPASVPTEPVILLVCSELFDGDDRRPPRAGGHVESSFRKMLMAADGGLKLKDPRGVPAAWDAVSATQTARAVGAAIVLLAELRIRDLGLAPDLKYVDYRVRRWSVGLRVSLIRVADGQCETMPELSRIVNRPDSEHYDGSDVSALVLQAVPVVRERIAALYRSEQATAE